MRVTKTIREYIEKQVYDKVYNSESLLKLKQEKEKAVNDFLEDKKRFEEACMSYLNDFIAKYQLSIPARCKPNVHFAGIYEHDLPEYKAYHDAEREAHKKAEQAILDIIVEMEMGGTKAELMEKLDALKF